MKPSVVIARKTKKRKSSRPTWSKEQENRYRELVSTLEQAGLHVRREELKRGHCWRAVSGSCRSMTERFVFVDSRLSPDEQIAFLGLQVAEAHASTPVSQAA